MKQCRFALIPVLLLPAGACHRTPPGPTLKAEVVCYVGRIDFGTKCSSNTTSPGDPHGRNGSLQCGLDGEISVTRWSFVESREGKDTYQFSRSAGADGTAADPRTQQVQFNGTRIVVFEDRDQVVVIQPPGHRGIHVLDGSGRLPAHGF